MENLPTIALVVVSIISAFSPIIAALINNICNLKVQKLEIYEKSKQKSLENFIDDCCIYFSNPSADSLRIKALSSMHKLLIYFDIDDIVQNDILEAINQRKHILLYKSLKGLSMHIQKK